MLMSRSAVGICNARLRGPSSPAAGRCVAYTLGVLKSSRMFICGSDMYFVTGQESAL